MRLEQRELEDTKRALAYLIDIKKLKAKSIERAIGAGESYISVFLGRKKNAKSIDPVYSRLVALNNYIYDNYPEAYKASEKISIAA